MTDLEKWIEAALTVADTTCMKDSEIIPTWPSDVAGFYPSLTIGALREWQVSQAKHNPDYRTVANRAIGDIARVTELLGVPEEEAGRPIVELVQEFLEARAQDGREAVARVTVSEAPGGYCGAYVGIEWLDKDRVIEGDLLYRGRPKSQGVPEGWTPEWRPSKDSISLIRMCELLNGMMDGTEPKKYGLLEPWKSTYERLAEHLATPATPRSCRHGVRLPHPCSECENDVENDPEYRKQGGK